MNTDSAGWGVPEPAPRIDRGFISDRVHDTGPDDGFTRFEVRGPMLPLHTAPRVVPGHEIRQAAITLAVDWLKSDPTTDADRLFAAADLIDGYIRTGAHPPKPEE